MLVFEINVSREAVAHTEKVWSVSKLVSVVDFECYSIDC